MGQAFFEIEPLIKKHNIKVLSSNYALYGDLSHRVMGCLAQLMPEIEIYSIDEAFINFTGFNHLDLNQKAIEIAQTIQQWTGIPVTIGIGRTKTLAKIANRYAKQLSPYIPAFSFKSLAQEEQILNQTEIEEVWGIGRRWAKKLRALHINTAWDLKQQDALLIKKQFNCVLGGTTAELQDRQEFKLALSPKPKKQIVVSRSFANRVTDKEALKNSLAHFIARAAFKLRKQDSLVKKMIVFLELSKFDSSSSTYHYQKLIDLAQPTADTSLLISAGMQALEQLFKPNLAYKKTGVVMAEISHKSQRQLDFFTEPNPKKDLMIETLDLINTQMGKGTLRLGREGFIRPDMRQDFKSPSYTSNWKELLIVRAAFKPSH